MTTSSTTHPEDLLEAFALDALEPEEEQSVLDHLEGCMRCSGLAAEYLETGAVLASTVSQASPSAELQARLMEAIEPEPVPVSAPAAPVTVSRQPQSWSRVFSGMGRRWSRALMPVTALAAVAIAAFLITENVQMTGEMDGMMAENVQLQESLNESRATAEAQLAQASNAIIQMQGDLQFLKNTLAQPGNQSLSMDTMQPGGGSHGVLVLAGDKSAAVIMASGLEAVQEDAAYHVWMMERGQRTWAGSMEVDENGWGTMAFALTSGSSEIDAVQISRAPLTLAAAGIVGDVVLEVALP